MVCLGLLRSFSGAQISTVRPTTAKPQHERIEKAVPSVRNSKVATPFDRDLAPRMQDAMRQVHPKGAKSQAHSGNAFPTLSGSGGTNVNFPGFVAAPSVGAGVGVATAGNGGTVSGCGF